MTAAIPLQESDGDIAADLLARKGITGAVVIVRYHDNKAAFTISWRGIIRRYEYTGNASEVEELLYRPVNDFVRHIHNIMPDYPLKV